jgi:magnesium-transporting ATPase (P-type)
MEPAETETLFYSISTEQVLQTLQAGPHGLTRDEAKQRLAKFGKNHLFQAKGESALKILWRQIKNPLIYILIFSSILAVVLGKFTDGIVVIAVVIINTLIGFTQEIQAGKAISSLMKLVPLNATVLRDGGWETISAEDLVVGDILKVVSGDRLAADVRLLEVKNLKVDESMLTGESLPVEKNTDVVKPGADLGDRKNMVYSGTYVTYGFGQGVVVATAGNTALGKISQMMESSTDLKTPLTASLDKVANVLTVAILIVSVLLLGIGLWKDVPLADSLLNAITLAVAAIPEGLPAIVTIALAIGVKRMAKKNAIIRKLPAVETLGSTTIICSDKTGTLTRNEMTVQELYVGGKRYELSGVGYKPEGTLNPLPSESDAPALRDLILAGVLCNDSMLITDKGHSISGDPTEAAIVVAGHKTGIVEREVRKKYPRLDAMPFESENQFMVTLNRFDDDSTWLLLKGAPEVVFRKCSGIDRNDLDKAFSAMASGGLRVLAIAKKRTTSGRIDDSELQGGFTLLGFVGMTDPPREEAIAAIEQCHTAGITVKMITGDHVETAAAIGKKLNLVESNSGAVAGAKLDGLSQQEIEELSLKHNIFARVTPEHKLQIVKALQRRRNVVAMTGDGVNDAPALKQADIGVAMGITGTDVSKEASDMILKDDNFTSIVAAVREGRRVYDNLVKSLLFVLPTNLGLALVLVISVLFFPEVNDIPIQSLLPVHALWINMITTVTLALPLAFEKSEAGVMNRPPRNPAEPILNKPVIIRTITSGLLMSAISTGLFLYEYYQELPLHGHDTAIAEAQTIAVTSIVVFQIFYLIHCRSFYSSLSNLNIVTNPSLLGGIIMILILQLSFIYVGAMNAIFHSSPLNGDAWMKTILVSAAVYPLISLEKFITLKVTEKGK